MAAHHLVQLSCDLQLDRGCKLRYPEEPSTDSTRAVREQARTAGWETLRHTTGRDVCPRCRIVEINNQAMAANTIAAEPEGAQP